MKEAPRHRLDRLAEARALSKCKRVKKVNSIRAGIKPRLPVTEKLEKGPAPLLARCDQESETMQFEDLGTWLV